MKNFSTFLLVAFCIFISVSSCNRNKIQIDSGVANPESAGFSSERLARLDTFLVRAVETGMMPNAVTYVYRHGKLVHHKAYGWKNLESREPVELNSIFRIASQTKAITSVGLMLLYEKGLFLLDEPVSKYIPEFKNPKVLIKIDLKDTSYTSRPAKHEITIRHLLSHTSGINYGNELSAKEKIPGVNSLDPITIGEAIRKLAKLPLSHDPGEAFTYGLNTDVLGFLIEVISGEPLDVYLQKNLFVPLEMNDTHFYLPKEKENRLVELYSKDSLNTPLYRSTYDANQTYPYSGAKKYLSGGAGLSGTISDYANFCNMLLHGGNYNGKQIIGRKTLELMTRNQIGEFEVWETDNKFGLGFEIRTEEGLITLPGSVGSFGWGGMYSTDYFIDPTEDMYMLIYTNANPFANPDISKRFKVLVYQALI